MHRLGEVLGQKTGTDSADLAFALICIISPAMPLD
jgi:hypothetical protein